jgi:hypothetical protein
VNSPKISDAMLEYIREEAERIRFGKIVIEVNENSNKADIVVESRVRFDKNVNKTRKC